MKKYKFEIIMAVIMLTIIAVLGQRKIRTVMNTAVKNDEGITVVIDAGHGGEDPGKVGINNALEKDINLSIAYILKEYLEAENINVVMTREDDEGLYDDNDKNKKTADLKKRIEIIKKADPVLAVSIHQNSYEQEYVSGAQVFYFSHSESSKILAEYVQEELKAVLDESNDRAVKSNDSYYLLKKTPCTTIIAECGFLSNSEEAELLCNEEYQNKVAFALFLGIIKYINYM